VPSVPPVRRKQNITHEDTLALRSDLSKTVFLNDIAGESSECSATSFGKRRLLAHRVIAGL
jgi:hypothetical protein